MCFERGTPFNFQLYYLNPKPYSGTSLICNSAPLGPCCETMHRALWWSYGAGLFLMSGVPLSTMNPTP